MKRPISLLLLCIFTLTFPSFAGSGSDQTTYVGGSEKIEEGSEGSASIGNEKEFVFEYSGGQLVIPYNEVTDLEYGQQAGRRVSMMLLSKKRRHFLTIGWKDEKAQQHAAVFELGKSIVKNTIETLEAKTGKKVDYQDDDARKSMGKM
jgi:hypothetical protein